MFYNRIRNKDEIMFFSHFRNKSTTFVKCEFFLVQGAAVVAGSPGSSAPGIVGGQALVGFHEDALSQAAVGRAQLLLALVLGLALAADCGELVVLGFVLPAAELQLCIGTHRKNWLGKYTTKIS